MVTVCASQLSNYVTVPGEWDHSTTRKMLVFILCCAFVTIDSYKILVFSPTISRSHMISNGRIADELAIAGHDVVLFEPDFLNISEGVQSAKKARRMPVHGFSSVLHDVIQDCFLQ
ncbi:hypothetical protein GCK32_001628 [Trichostrongylus colubriformis]|uniref:Glucuronosyltransferase n=1 Tax=Trichostrongylus colubriformis TaxID=6319 RepID=A0AAN8FDZ6_TRICO